MQKFFHVVLKKDEHFYYEIFEVIKNFDGSQYATLYISQAISKEKFKDRVFYFKTHLDLISTHTTNEYLKKYFGEERLFFLSAKEAIDTIKQLYRWIRDSRINYTLKEHDKLFHSH